MSPRPALSRAPPAWAAASPLAADASCPPAGAACGADASLPGGTSFGVTTEEPPFPHGAPSATGLAGCSGRLAPFDWAPFCLGLPIWPGSFTEASCDPDMHAPISASSRSGSRSLGAVKNEYPDLALVRRAAGRHLAQRKPTGAAELRRCAGRNAGTLQNQAEGLAVRRQCLSRHVGQMAR